MSDNMKTQLWNLSYKRTQMSGKDFRKLLGQAADEIARLEREVERLRTLAMNNE
jgi:hypothetical protein